MIRRPILFVLIAWFVPALAHAQAEGTNPYMDETVPEEPAKGDGIVQGKVVDKQTGEPLAGTTVDVVSSEIRVSTDDKGRYKIPLPPGRYVLRVWTPGYTPVRVQNVFVYAAGTRKIDIGLEPEVDAADEYVIEAAPDTASVDSLAIERKRSAAVGDSLGRAEMSKTPDRNAAQAARRVVGVTIVGSRFVYVRGLGERYTNALLNGVPLPSPEPDRAAVPLDLFPTLVLESLTIVKTFTPDSPADFAGGSVRIETRSIPQKPLFQVSLSGGYNSQATFRDRLTHKGSSTDWLGFDGGAREFPGEIPEDQLVSTDKNGVAPGPNNVRQGNAVNTFMSAEKAFTPPNFGASVVWGDSWKLGAERRLGAVATLNYGRSYNRRSVLRRVLDPDPSSPSGVKKIVDTEERPITSVLPDGTTRNSFVPIEGEERGEESVSWGAYGLITYQFDKSNELNLTGMHTQLSDKNTSTFQAFYDVNQAVLQSTRLEFVSRTLDYIQLGGKHEFADLHRAELDWFASYARATRTEPNTRNTVYRFNDSDPTNLLWSYYDSSESGMHLWADQYENSLGTGLNWTQNLSEEGDSETKIKAGGLINLRTRNFEARRLALRRRQLPASQQGAYVCAGAEFRQECIDGLFIPANIGSRLELAEFTVPEDAYDAELNVYAAYAMGDVSLARDLRLILGERVEVTKQTIDPYDQFHRPSVDVPPGADLESTDMLPAAALVFSATSKVKTRFAVTRTLARPQLRELAPFAYSDYFGGRRISGNPDLSLTKIINADLRIEYFPTLSEALAFSVFYKYFKDPIEPVVKPSGDKGLVTFQNAEGARLMGIELEARKDLKFLATALKDFTVISNFTLARSRIQLDDADTDLTNDSRAMVNQAPYVLNAGLDYSNQDLDLTARISYNLLGPRIVEVGTDGLDDTYEQERHTVDLVAIKNFGDHIELKVSAQNVFNSAIVRTVGKGDDEDKTVYRTTDGAVYTLSGSYSY